MAVLLGFHGMLRPGELLNLCASDFVLPIQGLSQVWALYLRIRHPKMRRISARREHVRIDDPIIIKFAQDFLVGWLAEQPLFCSGKAGIFARYWFHLCSFFGISLASGPGLTPAALRAGGATYFYRLTDSAEWVRYRGRWASQRMLEIYLYIFRKSLLTNCSASCLLIA